jgi:hypothetical protein
MVGALSGRSNATMTTSEKTVSTSMNMSYA